MNLPKIKILMGIMIWLWGCASATGHNEAAGPEAVAPVSENCPQVRKTPMAPPAVHNLTNPLRATDENIQAGERLFHKQAKPLACKLCHGESGNGKGDPDFESTPPARNFTCAQTMNGLSDGQLFWIIRNGSPNTSMPAYADLPPDDIWRIIHYLRGFSKGH